MSKPKLPFHKVLIKNIPYVVLLGAVAFMLIQNRPATVPDVLASDKSLQSVLADSAQTGLPVVAFITSNTCGPCQKYKRNTLSDSVVVDWLSTSVEPIHIVYQKSPQEVAALGIRAFPTTVLFVDGKEVDRFEGGVSSKRLINWATAAAQPQALVTPVDG